MTNLFSRFVRDESGATAIEYGLIAALIAVVVIGAVTAVGTKLSGTFTIHYDESILSTAGCAPAGGKCSTCHQCSGATPACDGGVCVPCVTDSDCCAPLHCSQGRCYEEIP